MAADRDTDRVCDTHQARARCDSADAPGARRHGGMKIIIFGLTVSSSWGNGHATLWRGLIRALARRNCDIVFYERDTPYYALNRDLTDIPGAELVLYADWSDVAHRTRNDLAAADVGLVTS